jgi:DNA-binding transcriptional MocR family regulator
MPPPLMAEIATRWIEDGTATQLNEIERSEAAFRQGLARDILAGHDLRADPCGFHVWLPLPDHWRPDAFQASARQQNVDLRSGDSFAMNPKANSGGVRLCLSHEIDRDRVSLGLQRIARLLQARADDGAFVV